MRWRRRCLALLLGVLPVACSAQAAAPSPSPMTDQERDLPVRLAVPADAVGAVLAALLEQGLRAGDTDVIPQPVADADEAVAALLDGRIDAAVADLDVLIGALAQRRAPADLDAAAGLLFDDLLPADLQPLGLAVDAERGFAIAVAESSAATAVSDLADGEPVLLGGPVGLDALEPDGVAGIEEAYGLDVTYLALSLDALPTYEAVRDGTIDALVLDASSPNVVRERLRALADDRELTPAANVVVVVRGAVVGDAARTAVSQDFGGLTTRALAEAGSDLLDGVTAEQLATDLAAR